jgi:hypothetical protein
LTSFAARAPTGLAGEFLLAQALVWGLTLLNVLGVRNGARLQVGVMLLNVVPLLLFSAVALARFDPSNLRPFAPHGWAALPVGAAMIVWAYSGIESATIPAEEVRGAGPTIRRGTLLGYALGTLVFLAVAVSVAGVVPNGVLAESKRPMAEAAGRVAGGTGALAISLAAIAAGIGTLNGWILLAGRIPVSAAEDGVFPARLGRIHPRFRTPLVALLAGGAVSSAVLCLGLSRTLLDRFDSIVASQRPPDAPAAPLRGGRAARARAPRSRALPAKGSRRRTSSWARSRSRSPCSRSTASAPHARCGVCSRCWRGSRYTPRSALVRRRDDAGREDRPPGRRSEVAGDQGIQVTDSALPMFQVLPTGLGQKLGLGSR